ncbi:hypothetical protein AB1L88_26850 [Tautonia sp. JC769]|uniref:hypothetical protein n=1 Tax=Tautonia sp. JC769 TaxID=3232135 RepID=UPI00345848F9
MKTKILARVLLGGSIAISTIVATGIARTTDDGPHEEGPDSRTALSSLGASEESLRIRQRLREESIRARHYRGIRVRVEPELEVELRHFQRSIAAEIERFDYVPQERTAYFSWLASLPGRLTGWNARIERVDSNPGGTVVVIGVSPSHSSGVARVNDEVFERYLLRDGQPPQYLGSWTVPGPRVTVF